MADLETTLTRVDCYRYGQLMGYRVLSPDTRSELLSAVKSPEPFSVFGDYEPYLDFDELAIHGRVTGAAGDHEVGRWRVRLGTRVRFKAYREGGRLRLRLVVPS
jgi:hypothetical protein